MIKEYIGEKVFDTVLGVVKFTVGCSYWICLITSMVSIMLYVAGVKKAGKNVTAAMVIYFLIECFGKCIEDIR